MENFETQRFPWMDGGGGFVILTFFSVICRPYKTRMKVIVRASDFLFVPASV